LSSIDSASLHNAIKKVVARGINFNRTFQDYDPINGSRNLTKTKISIMSLNLLNKEGINTTCYFIIGFPGENTESIDNTIKFLNNIATSGSAVMDYIMSPFFLVPLSPIYEIKQREQYGLVGYLDKWRTNTLTSDDVSRLIMKIFLEVKNDIFYLYFEDTPDTGSFFFNVSQKDLKDLKKIRQHLQQAIVKQEDVNTQKDLWNKLGQRILGSNL